MAAIGSVRVAKNAKQFLKENPDIRQVIEDRVRKELGLVREPEVAVV